MERGPGTVFHYVARIKRAISRGLGEKTEGGFDSSRTTSANTFFPSSSPPVCAASALSSPLPPPLPPFPRLPGFVLPFHVRSSSRENAHPPWHRSRNHSYSSLYRGCCRSIMYTGCTSNFEASDGIKI